jgi:outer membrane lipase/esterase
MAYLSFPRSLRVRTAAAAALAAAVLGTTAEASSFTSFWALGDSLSDDGNFHDITGEPSPPYFEGRFSNGRVWAEHVADDFEGLPTGNFAYGFSRAVPDGSDPIPDLPAQVGLFAAGSAGQLGTRPVVSIWSGNNDLLFRGIPEGRAVAVGREAAKAVGASALALSSLGVRDVALFTMPDLGSVPRYALSPDPKERKRATRGSHAFNKTLAWQIPKLERAGLNVIEIDIAGLFQQMIADPEAFGVKNATIPCLAPGTLPCSPAEALERAFFDPVHPNSVIHGQIADVVRTEIAPVPLPLPAALLLAALAGLGLVGKRRARASA